MRAKVYLDTPAFRVSCPNQTGGSREEQLLTINGNTVTASAINHDFVSAVIERVIEDRTCMQDFSNWKLLTDAIYEFFNDVEIDFMHRVAMSIRNQITLIDAYDADHDSDSSGSILGKPARMRRHSSP